MENFDPENMPDMSSFPNMAGNFGTQSKIKTLISYGLYGLVMIVAIVLVKLIKRK